MVTLRRSAAPLLYLTAYPLLCGQLIACLSYEPAQDVVNDLTYETEGPNSEVDAASDNEIMTPAEQEAALLEEALKDATASDFEAWDSDDSESPTQKPEISLTLPQSTPGKPTQSPQDPKPHAAAPLPNLQTNAHPTTLPPPYPVVSAPLDALFDFVLGAARYELIANHSTEEPVPDFKQQFKIRVGPLKVHGHLDANNGVAGDLSSLYRDGSVSLTQEAGGVLVLNAAAGLHKMQVRYNHYSARAGPIRVSGSLEAEASPAALRAELELRPPCSLRLRALRVAALGPLRVRASGLGVLRRLLPLISRWLNRRLRGDVETAVVKHLTALIQQRLQHFTC